MEIEGLFFTGAKKSQNFNQKLFDFWKKFKVDFGFLEDFNRMKLEYSVYFVKSFRIEDIFQIVKTVVELE